MTNIDIYLYINNTNNYTKLYSNDHALTDIYLTLDTSQNDKALLNANALKNMP